MASAPKKKPAGGTARTARANAKRKQSAAAKAKADKAARVAKAAKATGPRLTAAKAALRDSMIIARAAQGMPYAVIATEAKVTTRTVERVVAERRKIPSPLEQLPMDLLDEMAVGYRLSIGDYEAMALAFFEENPSVSLGAKKAADETRARLHALLADVGKLPQDLELFRSEMEMQRIAEQMAGMMRRVATGDATADDAVAFFVGLVSPQNGVVVEIQQRSSHAV